MPTGFRRGTIRAREMIGHEKARLLRPEKGLARSLLLPFPDARARRRPERADEARAHMRSTVPSALAAAALGALAAPAAVAMGFDDGGRREFLDCNVTMPGPQVAVPAGEIDELSSRHRFDLVEKVLSLHPPGAAADERDEMSGRHPG
jgi:hypothetical protein